MSPDRSVVLSWTLAFTLALCLIGGVAQAVEFRNLWQTPDQRAAHQLENDQVEALIEDAPDARWRGIGHYRSEDYEAAAEAFATDARSSERSDDKASAPSARRLDDLYNQATALTRSGEYDQAISLLDQVIEQQPDSLDAQQNRSIAETLKTLVEEQQEPEPGGEGESGEQGEGEGEDSSDSDESEEAQEGAEQSGDSEAADSSDSTDDSESSSEPSSSNSEPGAGEQPEQAQGDQQEGPAESGDAETTQTDDEAMQEAADALAAELAAASDREAEADSSSENEQALSVGGDESEAPLSEDDQATEQWLRRIPDDPAGLLRRKLEQSHRNEYPEVRDAQRAW